MLRRSIQALLLLSLVVGRIAAAAAANRIDDDLAVIARTGPQGARATDARAACDRLSENGGQILVRLLGAMETENPVAANWYRSVFETVVERESAKPNVRFPLDE